MYIFKQNLFKDFYSTEYYKIKMTSQFFFFLLGNASGIYIAQNYNVPDLKNLATRALNIVKVMEEKARKD